MLIPKEKSVKVFLYLMFKYLFYSILQISFEGLIGNGWVNGIFNSVLQSISHETIQNELDNINQVINDVLFDVIDEFLQNFSLSDITFS